jgi:hypothetical protein
LWNERRRVMILNSAAIETRQAENNIRISLRERKRMRGNRRVRVVWEGLAGGGQRDGMG